MRQLSPIVPGRRGSGGPVQGKPQISDPSAVALNLWGTLAGTADIQVNCRALRTCRKKCTWEFPSPARALDNGQRGGKAHNSASRRELRANIRLATAPQAMMTKLKRLACSQILTIRVAQAELIAQAAQQQKELARAEMDAARKTLKRARKVARKAGRKSRKAAAKAALAGVGRSPAGP